jgi:hypothetical protein
VKLESIVCHVLAGKVKKSAVLLLLHSVEERLIASLWVHERPPTYQIMAQVMTAFYERFNKALQ